MAAKDDLLRCEGALGGLWAHLLDAEGAIEYQVQILRPAPRDTWLARFFSFVDGEPTHLGCVSELTLTDRKKTRMYADNEEMVFVYEHGALGYATRRLHGKS